MSCEIVDLLERINRLSEIALEFHGEDLGELAAREVVGSALDLADTLDESDESEEDAAEAAEADTFV